jgi:hypothetical protein
MVRDPILIERPIIAGGRAGLGRSPENVKKPAAQFWAPADVACAIGGETLKFNVIVEGDSGARTECALEYRPADKTLRVITFY